MSAATGPGGRDGGDVLGAQPLLRVRRRANVNAGIEEELLEVGHYTAADAEAGVAPTPVVGG